MEVVQGTVLKVRTIYPTAPKKPKKLWDNYKELFEVMKSDKVKYVVAAATKDGIKYVYVREWQRSKSNLKWYYTRDCLTIPVQYPVVTASTHEDKQLKILDTAAELINAITQAVIYTDTMDLADENAELWLIPKTATERAKIVGKAELEEYKNENK